MTVVVTSDPRLELNRKLRRKIDVIYRTIASAGFSCKIRMSPG